MTPRDWEDRARLKCETALSAKVSVCMYACTNCKAKVDGVPIAFDAHTLQSAAPYFSPLFGVLLEL